MGVIVFRTALLSSAVRAAGDHAVVLVSDASHAGSRHLVDVGVSYPVYEPVSLDFEGSEGEPVQHVAHRSDGESFLLRVLAAIIANRTGAKN
jgi:hypothetical protein